MTNDFAAKYLFSGSEALDRPLDYRRLVERSPDFTHAISPSPPGVPAAPSDASAMAALSQHEVMLAGRCDWTVWGEFFQKSDDFSWETF